MKTLAIVLCLALPALAQPKDAPIDGMAMSLVPTRDVVGSAKRIKALEAENADLKKNMPENPVVVVLCATAAALLGGIALGVAIDRAGKRITVNTTPGTP